jgi:hypothetical protein
MIIIVTFNPVIMETPHSGSIAAANFLCSILSSLLFIKRKQNNNIYLNFV